MDIYKNKKVFLSGHTGFKGSWLNLYLQYLGAEVFGYALPPHTNPNHFDLLNGVKRFNGIFADILDIKHLEKTLLDINPTSFFILQHSHLLEKVTMIQF